VFDIGFWEFALIAIVALVVVGPDRLPGMMRTAGQLIGRAKRTMRELKYDLEREAEFEEVKRLREDFSKKSLNDIAKTLERPIDIDLDDDLDSELKDETSAKNQSKAVIK
jgi:sec-independent protein translocase protein TatB